MERSEWEYGLVFGYVTICNHVIVTIINTAGQQAVMYNDLHAKLRLTAHHYVKTTRSKST